MIVAAAQAFIDRRTVSVLLHKLFVQSGCIPRANFLFYKERHFWLAKSSLRLGCFEKIPSDAS